MTGRAKSREKRAIVLEQLLLMKPVLRNESFMTVQWVCSFCLGLNGVSPSLQYSEACTQVNCQLWMIMTVFRSNWSLFYVEHLPQLTPPDYPLAHQCPEKNNRCLTVGRILISVYSYVDPPGPTSLFFIQTILKSKCELFCFPPGNQQYTANWKC